MSHEGKRYLKGEIYFADLEHKTVSGSNVPQKCRMCGGKTQCKLSDGFMDLCTPKPVPKGTLIIDGCAIFISKRSSRAQDGQASIFKNRRPAMASAIDIDETGNIRLTIWKKAYQPQIYAGKCYQIHNAVTDLFGGSYQRLH